MELAVCAVSSFSLRPFRLQLDLPIPLFSTSVFKHSSSTSPSYTSTPQHTQWALKSCNKTRYGSRRLPSSKSSPCPKQPDGQYPPQSSSSLFRPSRSLSRRSRRDSPLFDDDSDLLPPPPSPPRSRTPEEKTPWRQTPLVESAALSQSAGWLVHPTLFFSTVIDDDNVLTCHVPAASFSNSRRFNRPAPSNPAV